MLARIGALEHLLECHGINVPPSAPPLNCHSPIHRRQAPPPISITQNSRIQTNSPRLAESPITSPLNYPSDQSNLRSATIPLPLSSHVGLVQDNFNMFSSQNGAQFSVFGIVLNIAATDPADLAEPNEGELVYNKSFRSCLQSIMHINQPCAVDFPSREDGFMFTDWYFMMINPFTPILHKQTHFSLVNISLSTSQLPLNLALLTRAFF